MKYESIFTKNYFQQHDDEDKVCRSQGRNPTNCPASKVIKEVLRRTYGPDLERSKCECSMSLVNRPDPFFGLLPHRSTRQVFLFNKSFPLGHSKSFIGALDVRCPSSKELDILQKSPKWIHSVSCAMGYLSPPRYMMSDNEYSIPVLNFYSVHGGILPFLCTPFISHHRFFGYLCAQAAIYLALEMTLRFQSAPHSPATISHIVAERISNKVIGKTLIKYCDSHNPKHVNKTRHGFYLRGLSAEEIESLLDDEFLNTKSLTQHIGEESENHEEDVILHVKSMLNSGIPVLALVDYNTLVNLMEESDFSDTEDAHVITIIGYRVARGSRKFRIVFHDGHLGPYRELSIDRLVQACYEGSKRRIHNRPSLKSEKGLISLFSAIPKKISSKGYIDLFHSVRPLKGNDNKRISCVLQLSSLGQLLEYLSKYSPGRLISIKDKTKGSHILKDLTNLEIENSIWIVEYRVPVSCSTDNDTKDSVMDPKDKSLETFNEVEASDRGQNIIKEKVILDLFDAEGTLERIGLINLGTDPEKAPWKFLSVPDSKKNPHINPLLEEEFEKDCDIYPIGHN